MIHKYFLLFFLMIPFLSKAQIGGENTYEFLNLVNSARMAALGGNQVALSDETDLNVAYNNPSLLSVQMAGYLTTNYVSYISNINYGYVAYSFPIKWNANLALGMHYINYGNFTEALANGTKTGNTFKAAEYALNIIWSYQINQLFTVGATIKPIWSSFETYQSAAIAADFGASFISEDGLTTLGLTVKNVGTQITPYYEDGERENLPADIQLGFSKRLGHAPIRILATLQHLQEWNLIKDEKDSEEEGQTNNKGSGNKFLQHLVLGAELLPSDNFTIRAGYNYQRRKELAFTEKMSTVGFSFGFGFKISRFNFNYAMARYHLAGVSNHFSIGMRLIESSKQKRYTSFKSSRQRYKKEKKRH